MIKSIVILGGGTAGWMAAGYLQRAFCQPGAPLVDVTVVESPEIGILGVGEATLPTLKHMLQVIGITEDKFLQATEATFKTAIRFRNWRNGGTGSDVDEYYHPFENPPSNDSFALARHWIAARQRGTATRPYAHSISVVPALCDALKSPKMWDSKPFESPAPYAYHLDAVLFAQLMRDTVVGRGVKRIEDTVESVVFTETGDIEALQTKENGLVTGDLFIDCSGFSGFLLGKALKTGFKSYQDNLLCDRAVAMRLPHQSPTQPLRPYTTATALESGWVWEIDLFNRTGTGYVYSSNFISDDEAEHRLRRHNGVSDNDHSARLLNMRVGRSEAFWVKNVVGIGLAGGFIEPLESTGIYLIEMGLKLLFDHIVGKQTPDVFKRRYNHLMTDLYDHLRDFIVIHYYLSRRRDTAFWRAATAPTVLSDVIREKLEMWKYRAVLPPDDLGSNPLFTELSYNYIINGLEGFESLAQDSSFLGGPRSLALFETTTKIQETAVRVSPGHREMLTRLRSALS